MQCTSGSPRDVIGPGQNLRSGIASAMSYQKIAKRRLGIEPRKDRQNICDDLRRDLVQAKSQEFQTRPKMDKGYFGGHSRRDPRGGMQDNGFPYLLCARGRHFVLFAKRPSRIGTINLEAIFARIGGQQSKIVKQRSAKGDLLINYCAAHGFYREAAEDIRSNAVVVEKLGRRFGQQVERRIA